VKCRLQRPSRSRSSGNSNEKGYFAQSGVSEDFHEIPVSDASAVPLFGAEVPTHPYWFPSLLPLLPSPASIGRCALVQSCKPPSAIRIFLRSCERITNCRSVVVILPSLSLSLSLSPSLKIETENENRASRIEERLSMVDGRGSVVGNRYRNNSVCQVAPKYTQRL